jgi:hypothetical protein
MLTDNGPRKDAAGGNPLPIRNNRDGSDESTPLSGLDEESLGAVPKSQYRGAHARNRQDDKNSWQSSGVFWPFR